MKQTCPLLLQKTDCEAAKERLKHTTAVMEGRMEESAPDVMIGSPDTALLLTAC